MIANTADDIRLYGLKVCPDLDTVMYTLGGGIDDERGWGRRDETWHVKEELAAYGVEPTWFGLGDRDIATHLVRTQMLDAGYPLCEVTEALCRRWGSRPGVRLLPMTDDRVETHVVIDDPEAPGGRRAVHFQEYWVRLHAGARAHAIVAGRRRGRHARARRARGDRRRRPGAAAAVQPGGLASARSSACPGIREALRRHPRTGGRALPDRRRRTGARHGRPAARRDRRRGLGRRRSALHYGARSDGGLLDGWLVDSGDAGAVERGRGGRHRLPGRAAADDRPDATARWPRPALALAAELRRAMTRVAARSGPRTACREVAGRRRPGRAAVAALAAEDFALADGDVVVVT